MVVSSCSGSLDPPEGVKQGCSHAGVLQGVLGDADVFDRVQGSLAGPEAALVHRWGDGRRIRWSGETRGGEVIGHDPKGIDVGGG